MALSNDDPTATTAVNSLSMSRSTSISSSDSANSSASSDVSIKAGGVYAHYSDEPPILFVRALYNYTSHEPNSLSFKAGDVISVCLQLDTGWWDGQLGKKRGWFPSNYCEAIDVHELSEEIIASCRLYDDEHDEGDTYENDDEERQPSPLSASLSDVSNAFDTVARRPKSPTFAQRQRIPSVSSVTSTALSSHHSSAETILPRASVASITLSGLGHGLTWDDLQAAVISSVERFLDALRSYQKSDYRNRIDDLLDCLSAVMTGAGFPGFAVSPVDTQYHHAFRHLIGALGRLELSAELAATSDSTKANPECEAECEGIIAATARFILVTRHHRPEPVARVLPGFVDKANVGGNWSGNGVLSPVSSFSPHSSTSNSSFDNFWGCQRNRENSTTSLRSLDDQFLDYAEQERSTITNVARDLLRFLEQPYARSSDEGILIEKAMRTMDLVRTFLALLESTDLTPLSKPLSPTVTDFRAKKQNLYDAIAGFILEMQNITLVTDPAPSLTRIQRVRNAVKEVDESVQAMMLAIQLLIEEKEVRDLNGPDAIIPSQALQDVLRSRGRAPQAGLSYFAFLGEMEEEQRSGDSTPSGRVSTNAVKSDMKVKQFFGDQPPYGSVSSSRDSREEPAWYLENEREDELIYDAKGSVKGGALVALVERLTRHDFLDTSFNSTFLLTYRSFTTSRTFFEMLIARFTIQPPDGLSDHEFEEWLDRKQKPIRLRVFNILKIWLEHYWDDPLDESEVDAAMSRDILSSLSAFAAQLMQQGFPGAGALAKVVRQRQHGRDVSKRLILNLGGSVPPPILPKRGLKKLKFTYIDALEFARQLTIIESQLYNRIRPLECLNRAWSAKRGSSGSSNGLSSGAAQAENIKALIIYSNQLTNWTAQAALSQPDLKKRVNVIKHLISVAEKCRQLNNFSSMTAIISALYSATIYRLNRTWEQIPQRSQVMLDNMNRLMTSSRNFGEYRAMLHLVNPPCVPFFGVYLTDLTFIEDGNTDMLLNQDNDAQMINFSKRAKSAEVIREIQQYQSVPYALTPVPELQDMIKDGLANASPIEELYDMSLSIEPRERGDEDKISRLLQDSGFL
ncbi:ras guanine nucleotide exchange factor domain-containing protein [Lipomyces tetrasporus]|uniref:Ras guanine nucleotide exchange factor domain-containing protein n=1 Tax=Lipomyces tetrasporus TaxID=54092 RepID=A0AAD7QUA2_9ASCO|nr:ras guanine nucleotide exchange factor domain-containing protein [Lipomyces tetrasporus]KAJ8101431.1 ras guanine nucleotide exchange factor domain-containing protein [Lipomyces tetrasporus]